jgi:hypothetical protein
MLIQRRSPMGWKFAITGVYAATVLSLPNAAPAREQRLHHNPYWRSLHHSPYPCSVLGHRPCIPYHTFCSVFDHHPCVPDTVYSFGQNLQLTIESTDDPTPPTAVEDHANGAHDLNTIRDIFSVLRACWIPPVKSDARSGTQLAVRLSFKRDGKIIGEPRVTYVTPGITPEVRRTYWDAVTAALNRCTPMAFSASLGGALAGRPLAIRFVDNRSSEPQ